MLTRGVAYWVGCAFRVARLVAPWRSSGRRTRRSVPVAAKVQTGSGAGLPIVGAGFREKDKVGSVGRKKPVVTEVPGPARDAAVQGRQQACLRPGISSELVVEVFARGWP